MDVFQEVHWLTREYIFCDFYFFSFQRPFTMITNDQDCAPFPSIRKVMLQCSRAQVEILRCEGCNMFLEPIPRYRIFKVIQLFHQSISTVMRMSHFGAWLIRALLFTSVRVYEKRALKRKLGSSRSWNHHGWLTFRLIAVMSLGHSKEDIVPKHTRMSK